MNANRAVEMVFSFVHEVCVLALHIGIVLQTLGFFDCVAVVATLAYSGTSDTRIPGLCGPLNVCRPHWRTLCCFRFHNSVPLVTNKIIY